MTEIDDLYEINRCLEILKNKIESDHNAIERVRELHKSDEAHALWRANYGAHACTGCMELYPCRTIKALDGEQ